MCVPLVTRATGLALAGSLVAGAVAGAETISFEAGCTAGEGVRIAAVGDLLFHDPLQRQSLAKGASWTSLWAPVEPALSAADIVYGNLEGPAAGGVAIGGVEARDPGPVIDGRVYGRAPSALVFNYHPSVLPALKASGFSVVSTANNHAADRGALGIDRTIDGLRAAGIAFTGTRKRGEVGPWSTVTRAKGLSVAWLACSYSTNGMPDRGGQVLLCHAQREHVLAELKRLAADPAIDAVMFTPHWGLENSQQPAAIDRALAHAAIEAGATAVIGAHPHVLQPWEKVRAGDGREGLVIYSTGNFVSNQQAAVQRSGIVAILELAKAPGAKGVLRAAGYVPTWVDFTRAGHRVTQMSGDGRARGSPLAATLRLLPAANRVTMEAVHRLPRAACPDVPASPLPPEVPVASLDRATPDAPEDALETRDMPQERAEIVQTTIPEPELTPLRWQRMTAQAPMMAAQGPVVARESGNRSGPSAGADAFMSLRSKRQPSTPLPPRAPEPPRLALRCEPIVDRMTAARRAG